MDSDDAGVLEAARAIRPYLGDLIGPAKAEMMDRRIADQLNGPAAETGVAGRLRAVLEEQEDTAWFLSRVLADAPRYRPPYQQSAYQRDIASPAGDPGLVEADRYACPRGDYIWYQPEVGTPIPPCPTHHMPLTRS
jgi:plasmid stabilization system protein ParE